MKFLHLTVPNGEIVSIVPAQIVLLRSARGVAIEAHTIVVFAGVTEAVRETKAEIEDKLKDW